MVTGNKDNVYNAFSELASPYIERSDLSEREAARTCFALSPEHGARRRRTGRPRRTWRTRWPACRRGSSTMGWSSTFVAPDGLQGTTITGYEYNVSFDGGTTWVTGNKDNAYNAFSELASPYIERPGICPARR